VTSSTARSVCLRGVPHVVVYQCTGTINKTRHDVRNRRAGDRVVDVVLDNSIAGKTSCAARHALARQPQHARHVLP
jgi:hypothetical protein